MNAAHVLNQRIAKSICFRPLTDVLTRKSNAPSGGPSARPHSPLPGDCLGEGWAILELSAPHVQHDYFSRTSYFKFLDLRNLSNFNNVDFLYNEPICSFVLRLCLQWTRKEKKTLSNDKPLWLIKCRIPCHSNNIT